MRFFRSKDEDASQAKKKPSQIHAPSVQGSTESIHEGCTCGGTCPQCKARATPATTTQGVSVAGATGSGSNDKYLLMSRDLFLIERTPPTFNPCSQRVAFEWVVELVPGGLLRSGWFVQHIENTYESFDATGAPLHTDASGQDFRPAMPEYWEAWKIIGAGGLSPTSKDTWQRGFAPGTRGNWSMKGRIYYVEDADFPSSFAHGNVHDARGLMSTTVKPGRKVLGRQLGSPREIAGEWNCCDPDPTNHFHKIKS